MERVEPLRITYSEEFKSEFMSRYRAGERPKAIFEPAGLSVSLIGYKRIERACAHWREAEAKDALCLTNDRIPTRDDIRARERRRASERCAAVRASQAAGIAALEAQVKTAFGYRGFSCLSGIIDCETRQLVAHVTSDSMEEQFVLDTYDQLSGLDLPEGIWSCSDQGVHYTARAFREKLEELGIGQSMSRRACCWDNAPIESFWGRMKSEIGPTGHMTHEETAELVDDYVDYCNHERGQARLGWLTPEEYARSLAA